MNLRESFLKIVPWGMLPRLGKSHCPPPPCENVWMKPCAWSQAVQWVCQFTAGTKRTIYRALYAVNLAKQSKRNIFIALDIFFINRPA